jgi:hypothetical protein
MSLCEMRLREDGPPHAKLVSFSNFQAHEAWIFFLDKGECQLCRMVLLTAIGAPELEISLPPCRVEFVRTNCLLLLLVRNIREKCAGIGANLLSVLQTVGCLYALFSRQP